MMRSGAFAAVIFAVAGVLPSAQAPQEPQRGDQPFRFRTGVEIINVSATVTDSSGRFVSGLRQQDFRVYQDDELQAITHFANERVPVSLGIVLDVSSSMDGEKMAAARKALDRFLYELLAPGDEVFLYSFESEPRLVEGWTTDRARISRQLARLRPGGGTALYEAVLAAVPMAQAGSHRKKALLIISDGKDTSSDIGVAELQRVIRETEVLVYAIGIDATRRETMYVPRWETSRQQTQRPPRFPLPWPFPGSKPKSPPPRPPSFPQPQPRGADRDDGVNAEALREITDDSGGRTEVIRGARDLDPATGGIADELSRQYYLGYAATGIKDGRWHTIRVEVPDRRYHVRARRGFIATP